VTIRPLTICPTFGPRALATVGAAFDQAWQEVESYFTGTLSRQAARLILANAILGAATDDSRDTRPLKWAGIRELACRGYLPNTETPRQRALAAIVESQKLISVSRVELKYLQASARSVRKSVDATSALLETARTASPDGRAGLASSSP
jgi:hypothetical protein